MKLHPLTATIDANEIVQAIRAIAERNAPDGWVVKNVAIVHLGTRGLSDVVGVTANVQYVQAPTPGKAL